MYKYYCVHIPDLVDANSTSCPRHRTLTMFRVVFRSGRVLGVQVRAVRPGREGPALLVTAGHGEPRDAQESEEGETPAVGRIEETSESRPAVLQPSRQRPTTCWCQVRSQCVTCSFRASWCSAHLSRVPAWCQNISLIHSKVDHTGRVGDFCKKSN